jgi:hypothetical protein
LHRGLIEDLAHRHRLAGVDDIQQADTPGLDLVTGGPTTLY